MSRKIDAYIFDLDGTLMDSEVLYVEGVRSVLSERGVAIQPDDALALVYGKSWPDVHEELCRRYGPVYPSIESMEISLRARVESLKQRADLRIPGSIALLRRLAVRFPVCIVSGSARRDVEAAVDHMGVGDCLAFLLGCEDYAPGKPDPSGFLMAANRMGLPPARCLVFEDSTAGIRAARAAGMAVVALRRPGRPAQDVRLADEVMEDLSAFDPALWSGGESVRSREEGKGNHADTRTRNHHRNHNPPPVRRL